MGPSAIGRHEGASRARALRRSGWALQSGVVLVWFGLALALAAALAFVLGAASPFVVAALALTMGGLLAPAAVSAQRSIHHELSRRRLALARAYAGEMEHLPPRLRALLLETRIVHSAVEDAGDGGPASRAVWEWLRVVERLAEPERDVLERLGLSAAPVREAVFRDTRGRPDQLRGGLTDSQQLQVGQQLSRFEATLSSARALPYR